MATQSGNWFEGYKGVSNFDPNQYVSRFNQFNFDPKDRLGAQGLNTGNLLWGAATGQQPSYAQMMQNQGVNQAMSSMYANPSLNPALSARLGSNMASQASAQGGQLRAQEMANARNAMAQYMMQQLQQRGVGAQTDINSLNDWNRIKMQQDIENAKNMNSQGYGGALLGMGSTFGASAIQGLLGA